jgi:hypothetical protein
MSILINKSSLRERRQHLTDVRLHDLATNRSLVDLDSIGQGFNDQQMMTASDSQPVTQQQQQVQPKGSTANRPDVRAGPGTR